MIDGALVDLTPTEQAVYDDRLAQQGIPFVPTQCSMLAARTVLYREVLLQLVETVIAGMTGEAGDLARIKWATALTVRRDDDLVTQVIPQLGKSEAEIDAMFVAGDLIDRTS